MNPRNQMFAASALSVAAALTCISGLAHAGPWSVTVLETTTAQGFPTVNAIWENRQGGSIDPGFQRPTVWLGAPGAAFEPVLPQSSNGATIVAMTQNNLIGEGFAADFGGYVVLVWNAQGSAVQVIQPPAPFTAAFANGGAANQQVGIVTDFNTGLTVPALWTGTTESFVNLLPQGLDRGSVSGTDGSQQVGFVSSETNPGNNAALWTGSANSFVNLHPGGIYTSSEARSVDNGVQVGSAFDGTLRFATAWFGTPQSMVVLHPANVPNITGSRANAIHNNFIAGSVRITINDSSTRHASLWTSPNAASHIDLHALLGPDFNRSEAVGVFASNDGVIRVIGNAELNGNSTAVLWTFDPCGFPLVVPASPASLTADLDANFVTDSCEPLDPADDCNANAIRDSLETLVFTNETFQNGSGPWSINGDATLFPAFVELTSGDFSEGGSAIRGPLTAGPTQRLRATFDFRLDNHLIVPADGISFVLYPSTLFGTDIVVGEDGLAQPGTLTVKFNTFENVAGEGSNSMYIIYGGDVIASNTNLPLVMTDGNWHRAFIDLTPDGRLSVALGNAEGNIQTVFNNVQLPNYQPQQYNIGFGGRSGGFASRQSVANVRLGVNGPNDLDGDGAIDTCTSCAPCPADFDNNGGVDGGDLAAFFVDFEAGEACADVDLNGGVDGGDLATFFTLFEAGGC